MILKKMTICLFILILGFMFITCSDRYLVSEGNEALINGKPDIALNKYNDVLEVKDDSEALKYNIAQAKYLNGKYDEANTDFEKLTTSDNDAIRHKAKTGIGNILMKTADMMTKQQPQKAYELYTKSIEKYREVIDDIQELIEKPITDKALRKNMIESKTKNETILKIVYNNLERAIRKRAEIQLPDNQDQQDQNQDQQDQNQDQQDQNQDQQDQNQDQQDQNQDQQDQNQDQQDQNQDKEQLSAEEARKLLEQMRSESEETEERVKQYLYQNQLGNVERDW